MADESAEQERRAYPLIQDDRRFTAERMLDWLGPPEDISLEKSILKHQLMSALIVSPFYNMKIQSPGPSSIFGGAFYEREYEKELPMRKHWEVECYACQTMIVHEESGIILPEETHRGCFLALMKTSAPWQHQEEAAHLLFRNYQPFLDQEVVVGVVKGYTNPATDDENAIVPYGFIGSPRDAFIVTQMVDDTHATALHTLEAGNVYHPEHPMAIQMVDAYPKPWARVDLKSQPLPALQQDLDAMGHDQAWRYMPFEIALVVCYVGGAVRFTEKRGILTRSPVVKVASTRVLNATFKRFGESLEQLWIKGERDLEEAARVARKEGLMREVLSF